MLEYSNHLSKNPFSFQVPLVWTNTFIHQCLLGKSQLQCSNFSTDWDQLIVVVQELNQSHCEAGGTIVVVTTIATATGPQAIASLAEIQGPNQPIMMITVLGRGIP